MDAQHTRKILFLVGQETGLIPGQRFRFEQYLDHFSQNGIACVVSPLVSRADNRVLYSSGNFFKKVELFRKAWKKRLSDLAEVKAGKYDAVFVYRDAIMVRSTHFERQIHKAGVPMIFDFDDSIWLQDVSDANRIFSWLKDPAKTSRIISLCSLVIAGNQYLCDYGKRFNPQTIIIPTTIDTDKYVTDPSARLRKNDTVTIGWSGSITTIKHFKTSLMVLKTLKDKYGDKINIAVIGDGNFRDASLGITGKWWNGDTELEDLSVFDIGIMPLPDDQWSRGKCGLKGLQYMALEIPTVMSPVGVNADIVQDGENGFLAAGHDEWVEKLSLLIESKELREKLGKAGRKTVVEHYSVEANKHRWLEAFQSVFHGKT